MAQFATESLSFSTYGMRGVWSGCWVKFRLEFLIFFHTKLLSIQTNTQLRQYTYLECSHSRVPSTFYGFGHLSCHFLVLSFYTHYCSIIYRHGTRVTDIRWFISHCATICNKNLSSPWHFHSQFCYPYSRRH